MWWRVFVVWIRCLFGNEWPERRLYSRQEHFGRWLVVWLHISAKRCRKNSDPAASQALLGSTFACPGEPSQSNKEASGQRDERPPSTVEHPDHDFVLSELPLQSLWSKALCQAGLQQL